MKLLSYDTHAHIDLYNKKMKRYLDLIESNGSYTIVMTNVPRLYEKYSVEYDGYRYIRFALGLHPQLVSKYKSQLSVFYSAVAFCRYIGEVGLDFTKGIDKDQILAFEGIMEACRNHGGKIISIHSRRAVNHVLDVIGEDKGNKIILHWFSGTMKELERAIEMDFYFSVNTQMLMSKRGAQIIQQIPTNKLLVETDAPFTKITKEGYNLQFFETVISKTASILQLAEEEVHSTYIDNFIQLIKK